MVRSARAQTIEVEIIGIDNTKNAFSNAASALIEGTNKASGDVLVFCHQDIEFIDPLFMHNLIARASHNPKALYGVAGVSDSSQGSMRTISSIQEGPARREYKSLISEIEEVFTLDECLFAFHKDLLADIAFDSETCNGWHFYAVDMCLQTSLLGIPSFVIKSGVWHKSTGKIDKSYLDGERRLAKKYRGRIKLISTTCSQFPTGRFAFAIHAIFRRAEYYSVIAYRIMTRKR